MRFLTCHRCSAKNTGDNDNEWGKAVDSGFSIDGVVFNDLCPECCADDADRDAHNDAHVKLDQLERVTRNAMRALAQGKDPREVVVEAIAAIRRIGGFAQVQPLPKARVLP